MKGFLLASVVVVAIATSAASAADLGAGNSGTRDSGDKLPVSTAAAAAAATTGSLGQTIRTAPALRKPAATAPMRIASRRGTTPRGEPCSRLGCRGYTLVGVGF